jgi:DNA polymerase-3 subunit alpha
VGPGRGSGAGSLVAYALKITDLDPIEFELLFERFLNPERVSMPDFDVDFCMERRDEVIDYVARTYGRDRVSQIITYGSMAAKAVVRDVGRVLGHPYGFVDRIAKLIPFELGITLDKALQDSEDLKKLYESDEEVRALIDLAQSLEGLTRNAGKHAGGVVIAPSDLTDFSPLYCEAGGDNLVTQFDKDDVEAVGLVKFDFLGLRTLTIIDWALETINRQRAEKGENAVDISLIPLNDPPTYELLKSCQTTAVFQLESRGMKDLIKRLRPDCFEDIIALVALFRPGPLQSGMVDDYINVKHGKQKAEFPHPILEPILKPTNGVIVYQEQVMKIAQDMAGYTLGGADLLRRAMGKKKAEEMAKQREIFVTGATGLGIDEKISGYIFDLMEKFAGYGFNKSHSAAYALVSYQTAWLKAHYPSAFMAAVLSSDMDKTDKVVVFIEECRQMKLAILPPDINRSEFRFTALDNGSIQYGLGAIKGVGESAINEILEERRKHGFFADLRDLCRRIDTRKANRRVLEALIRAGALDSIDDNRADHMVELTDALKAAEQHGAMAASGQDDLFGLLDMPAPETAHAGKAQVEPWSEEERLNH